MTPAKRGKGKKVSTKEEIQDQTPAVRIIACIEDPLVISKILTHLDDQAATVGTGVKYRYIRLAFSPEHSNMIKSRSDLAEDLL